MLNRINIGPRMAGMIILGAGVILATIIGYSYVTARRLLEEELESKGRYMALATANRIETVVKGVERSCEGVVLALAQTDRSEERIYPVLREMLKGNEEIYGSCVAMPPAGEGATRTYKAPYVYRNGEELVSIDLAAHNYQYDVWDWYALPRDLKRPVWTEPFFDEGGGNALMVTYAIPVFRDEEKKDLWAVVTCDVTLDWVTRFLGTLRLGKEGYASLISNNGSFISHPRAEYIMNESVFSLAEERNDLVLRRLGQSMIQGEVGFVPYTNLTTDQPSWLAYASVPSAGWSVGLVFPKAELLERVKGLTQSMLVLGIIGFALLLVTGHLIARSIVTPLMTLENATRSLSAGNLEVNIPRIPGNDEVARLASSFICMRDDLKEYMARLQDTTVAKERIEGELRIAHSIQMSLVPKTFPPFPERKDFEIYAVLDPAREIGGDFYDFFMPNEDTLCLVIGDVSGKGVPAALFMAVTRTFLKALWREGDGPAQVLSKLNDELAKDNDSNMFVTLLCARIQLSTGHCRFARGGHNPPFRISPQGHVERLPWVKGAIIGVIEGTQLEEGEVTLDAGDMLFLFTDGVTEAMNPAGEVFGENRTLETLGSQHTPNCRELVYRVRERLKDYARDCEQSDDITMLAFLYTGG